MGFSISNAWRARSAVFRRELLLDFPVHIEPLLLRYQLATQKVPIKIVESELVGDLLDRKCGHVRRTILPLGCTSIMPLAGVLLMGEVLLQLEPGEHLRGHHLTPT